MIISHKYQFIFIKTGKTAGTSIETYLSPFCGEADILTPFKKEEPGHQARNYSGFTNHMPAYKIRSLLPATIWNKYFKFCVERNPWDKAISHYYFINKVRNLNISFDQYVNGRFSCVNFPLYTDPSNQLEIIVDRVIRYENLSSELSEVFADLQIPFQDKLTTKSKTQYRSDRRPYREVYTENQKQVIYQKYRHEIQLFGYKF